jgi:EAL domain-containing protein (putative c-di-GMP-specific phosphodiesterase class I)
MTSTPVVGDLHSRRVRRMLWGGAALLLGLGLGLGWSVFFARQGEWAIFVLDLGMILVGGSVALLTRMQRTRAAFFLLVTSMYLLVCGISLVFDIPSAGAPRSTHHFLLVLTVASLLVLRDEKSSLRYAVAGICCVSFVVLASSNVGISSTYALPDSIRVGGTWVNNAFSIIALYYMIFIMVADVSEHSSMEVDLRHGITRGEFFLVYQPQVTSQGQVLGAEALLRWQHPKRGLVAPDEFIPLAEKTLLILPLGEWVLSTACNQLATWQVQPDMADLTLSVNVSAEQFRQPDYVEQVHSIMERHGVRPNRLKLELTESLLVLDMEDIVQKMESLKRLGVGFSLDDFGTGYSSLNYLKRLPLDQLKIDKSFVHDVLTDHNDASIARMIITLGNSLGFAVIAEGVETQEQCAFLMQNDCHLFQGYLFSKPVPLEQFTAYFLKSCTLIHE